MLKAFWFFIQIAAIAGGAIWLSQRPGNVTLEFLSYAINIKTGYFILALIAFFVIFIMVYRLVRGVLSLPDVFSNMREKDKRKKGFQALTRGLVAVAAGDTKKATQYAKQTKNLMPKQKGLPVLLDAQAARLRGEEGIAKLRFKELLKDKDTAFLGIRGLIKSHMDEGDYESALEYAEEAYKLHPQQKWVVSGLYDLQLRNQKWENAEESLKNLTKLKAIPQEKSISDQVALHHIFAAREYRKGNDRAGVKILERAFKLLPSFSPTGVLLVKDYMAKNKKKKAISIIKKAWAENPHADYIALWDQLAPRPKKNAAEKRMKWFEELITLNEDDALSYMAAAQIAMDNSLWGEAKSYLKMAERHGPSAAVYKKMAVIAQHTENDDEEVNMCMARAASAMPDKVWICSDTGIVYEAWEPIAMPHGSFNTLIWSYPHTNANVKQVSTNIFSDNGALLIDPAA